MDLMKFINHIFGGANKAVQGAGQQAPAQGQGIPDITYNPNPNADIPYSAHTPDLSKLGNAYTANPTAPQFQNVDPGLSDYPADGPGGANPNDQFRVGQPTYAPPRIDVPRLPRW